MSRPVSAGTAWVILIMLAIGSLAVAESGLVTVISSAVIIAIAAYKARLIMRHFMELDSLSHRWRMLYTIWIVVACSVILIGNYVAVASA